MPQSARAPLPSPAPSLYSSDAITGPCAECVAALTGAVSTGVNPARGAARAGACAAVAGEVAAAGVAARAALGGGVVRDARVARACAARE